jgi:heme-degrading monooxygenase HmoA
MFLRLYWSRTLPGSWDAVRDRYVELGKADVPGRVVRWVTRDVNDPGNVILVTLWERQEDIHAWEASEQYQRSVNAIRPHLVGSQTVSLCEVMLESPAGLLDALKGAAVTLP